MHEYFCVFIVCDAYNAYIACHVCHGLNLCHEYHVCHVCHVCHASHCMSCMSCISCMSCALFMSCILCMSCTQYARYAHKLIYIYLCICIYTIATNLAILTMVISYFGRTADAHVQEIDVSKITQRVYKITSDDLSLIRLAKRFIQYYSLGEGKS